MYSLIRLAPTGGKQPSMLGLLALLFFFGVTILNGQAQDPLRYSLAGETSAAANRRGTENEKYNFKVGPVLIRMSGGGNIEFNDNINIADVGRKADVVLRPRLQFDGIWHVTDLNTLNLNLGLEYGKFLFNDEFDSRYPLATPNSALSFNLYTGDFRINFHDRFSYQENPLTQAQVAGVARFGRFTNTVGTTVDWDLNDVVLTGGYDYGIFLSTTDEFSYLDSSSHNLNFRATFTVDPTTKAGLNMNTSITSFDQNVLNDGSITTAGGFMDMQLSEYIRMHANAGVQIGLFDSGGINGDTNDLTGFYGDISLDHRLNHFISHTLSFGRNSTLSLNSNFVTIDFIRHMANFSILKDITLSTELFLEHGAESGGPLDETFLRYGGGFSIGYRLTSQLDMSAQYRFIQRDSNRVFRDFYQNSLGINFNYQF